MYDIYEVCINLVSSTAAGRSIIYLVLPIYIMTCSLQPAASFNLHVYIKHSSVGVFLWTAAVHTLVREGKGGTLIGRRSLSYIPLRTLYCCCRVLSMALALLATGSIIHDGVTTYDTHMYYMYNQRDLWISKKEFVSPYMYMVCIMYGGIQATQRVW